MTIEDRIAALSIHPISLPTPFPVGPVNSYFLGGDEPCLVDCGVKSARSRDALAAGLEAHSQSLDAMTRVLVTHPHDDHAGAAPALSRRTGAEICYHPGGDGRRQRSRVPFGEALARYGAPEALRAQLDTLSRLGERFGEPLESAPVRAYLHDADRLQVNGLDLEVLHTPGHDPAHLCFLAVNQGLIFCGDLLLPDITPNPLPHFDPEAPRGRQPSLALFRQSLRRVAALGSLVGLGGHGPPMPDTAAVAAHSLDAIARRSDAVLDLCARHPGETVFALAGRLFGEESQLGQALAFSEVLAHVDDLEDRGLLQVDHDAGVVVGLR